MHTEKLSEIVNRSGFPLQIGLERQIRNSYEVHGWRNIYSEHSWKNNGDGNSGFIDLVLEDKYRTSVLIIETKRVLESSWIFLVDDPRQMQRRHAKSWLMRHRNAKFTYFAPKELTLDPITPQSQYCVIDGQDPKSKPMLERIAADVVSSVEGFAEEERLLQLRDRDVLRMYFGAIVTTAKLQVCQFDPENISIADGKISNSTFTEVPFLRFRKQLASHHDVPGFLAVGGHQDVSRAKENTVFIVNALAITDFLKSFEVDDNALRGLD